MNAYLPMLVWFALWAAVIVFGLMITLYLFLMFMGKEELDGLRQESDATMRSVRDAEAKEKSDKDEARAERRRLRAEEESSRGDSDSDGSK